MAGMLETIGEAAEFKPTQFQELVVLQEQIEDFEREIKERKQINGIDQLEAELAERQADFKKLLPKVVDSVPFSEDKFLMAQGKKGDSYKERGWKLIRTSKSTRTVIAKAFAKAFPDIAAKICSIPVGKAEALVGGEDLEKFCTRKVTFDYELVNMSKVD